MRNRTANLIVGAQLTITILAALLVLVIADARAAWSAAFGGGISVVTTIYFAWRVFSCTEGKPLQAVARAFYVGEVSKMLLTAILFFIAIVWVDAAFLPLLVTYALTLMVYWMVLPFTVTEKW